LSAVMAALNPIAAVSIPAGFTSGSATFDASGSAAACNATIASYAWSASGAVHIVSGGTGSAVNVMASGVGTLTLTVKDSAGNIDTAVVNFTANGAASTAPSAAGSAASACLAPMTVTPAAPTIGSAFSPASVAVNAPAMLVLTFTNTNGFALTQSGVTLALPAGLTLGSPSPASSCGGAGLTLTSASGSVTLAGANIPANGNCNLSLSVKNTAAGTYVASVAANGLMTGPAGGNAAAASATLTVTAASSGGGGGGGSMDWLDIMLVVGVLLIVRGHAARRPRP
jgi:hypothetical protein